jgi:hypothetical protein
MRAASTRRIDRAADPPGPGPDPASPEHPAGKPIATVTVKRTGGRGREGRRDYDPPGEGPAENPGQLLGRSVGVNRQRFRVNCWSCAGNLVLQSHRSTHVSYKCPIDLGSHPRRRVPGRRKSPARVTPSPTTPLWLTGSFEDWLKLALFHPIRLEIAPGGLRIGSQSVSPRTMRRCTSSSSAPPTA